MQWPSKAFGRHYFHCVIGTMEFCLSVETACDVHGLTYKGHTTQKGKKQHMSL